MFRPLLWRLWLQRVVDWAEMPVAAQLQVMQTTSLLLGMHGTGLNNIAFARPGAVLVDLLPYCLANASDFWEISQVMRVRHYAWCGGLAAPEEEKRKTRAKAEKQHHHHQQQQQQHQQQ